MLYILRNSRRVHDIIGKHIPLETRYSFGVVIPVFVHTTPGNSSRTIVTLFPKGTDSDRFSLKKNEIISSPGFDSRGLPSVESLRKGVADAELQIFGANIAISIRHRDVRVTGADLTVQDARALMERFFMLKFRPVPMKIVGVYSNKVLNLPMEPMREPEVDSNPVHQTANMESWAPSEEAVAVNTASMVRNDDTFNQQLGRLRHEKPRHLREYEEGYEI